MKTANKSDFVWGLLFFTYSYSFAFIPLLPIYGGLVHTTSYFAPIIFACKIIRGSFSKITSRKGTSHKSLAALFFTSSNLCSRNFKSCSCTSKIDPYSLASLRVSAKYLLISRSRFCSISVASLSTRISCTSLPNQLLS